MQNANKEEEMTTAVRELNIIIAGVGGQGVVLLSDIMGNAAVKAGFKVRGSEVLGMAQRGGSVFSNIRIGEDVFSPMTTDGKCDILIAIEPSEALRNIQYVSKNTTVIMNTVKVIPATVSLGKSSYPDIEVIQKKMQAIGGKVITLDAVDAALKAGNRQTSNVVMLGALFGSGKMPISLETIKEAVSAHVPAKAVAVNLTAFDLGFKIVSQQIN
jgi:indolepyruvate ferredoxin oxidoreductase beta subunit